MKLNGKLTSRKFLMAVVGAVLILVEELAGVKLDPEYVVAQMAPFVAYILGEGFADAFRKK